MARTPDARPIPTSEPYRIRSAWRRTALLRAALMLSLLAVLALAVLVARGQDVRHAPLIPSGTTGMLVLDLSASVYEGALAQTVQKLAEGDERVGVVAFSDGAYELVPPGTPGRELLPLLRFFTPDESGQLPAHEPWEQFHAGTQISSGLRVAREALEREQASPGSIVLISDLEILPDEVVHLGEEVALLHREGIQVRIVPLFPTPEKRKRIEEIVGSTAFLRESESEAPVRAPEARSLAAAAPWVFLAVGALLVLLLTANERLLSRLEVRR